MSKVISETQDNCGRPNSERNRWARLQAEGGLRGPQGVLMAHREKSLLHLFGFFFFLFKFRVIDTYLALHRKINLTGIIDLNIKTKTIFLTLRLKKIS